jgi:histidyl-tRNA synthetase
MPTSIGTQDFVRQAVHTANHFGFHPIERLKDHPACKGCVDKIDHKDTAIERRNDALHGMLTGGMTSYFDHKLNGIEGPTLFYSIDSVPRTGEPAITFQIFNVKKSIAEVMLIQTIRSFLNDIGHVNHVVRINSLGDSDSVTRYVRELTNFLKRRVEEMPTSARELMKEHPLVALMHLIEKEHDLARRSPNPLEYLTDMSRKHFREIVEFLDQSGTPFEIDPKLIGHHECYSDALFAFDLMNDAGERYEQAPLYIRGGRYSAFVNKMSKSKTPAVGAVVVLKDKKSPTSFAVPRSRPEPSIFVVQLGFGPKIRSLLLIDELKRAGVQVQQNVMSDSLSEQLRMAESRSAEYAVIIGQKEFVEDRAILRNLKAQTQTTIPMALLADHLRKVAHV